MVLQKLTLILILLLMFVPAAAAQSDPDGDGINDPFDACPNDPANGSVFPPESPYLGCPDRDMDGVADQIDQCPDTFTEVINTDPGFPLGCPVEAGPPAAAPVCEIIFTGSVTYAQPGGAILNPSATPGTYVATGRSDDYQWWLINGTDWVQGEITEVMACGALPVAFTGSPSSPANPVNAACGPAVTHTVQRGETLFRIAQQYGTTVDTLVTANQLASANRIFAGQQIAVPCAAQPVVQPQQPAVAPPAPAFVAPTTAITTRAANLTELLSLPLTGFPVDLAVYDSLVSGDFAGVMTDDGLLTLYELAAPTETPFILNGANEVIYQFSASANGLIGSVAFDSAGVGSNIELEPANDDAALRRGIPIPVNLGTSVTDIALSDAYVAATSGATTGAAPGALQGVVFWDVFTGQQANFVPVPAPVAGLSFSADGSHLAVALLDGTVQVWSIATFAPVFDTSIGADGISLLGSGSSLALNADGSQLAVGGDDGTLRLYDVNSGALAASIPLLPGQSVLALAFNPDSTILAVAGGVHPAESGATFTNQGSSITLLDVTAMQAGDVQSLGELDGHAGAVTGLAFTSDSTLLISTGADNTLRLWGLR